MGIKELEKEIHFGDTDELHRLVLFNSNHFYDDVITQLQKATGYDIIQCEQIAIIAHTKGKAVVKSGEIEELNQINSVLKEINLITEIV
ncbi:MAG: ATP-dependent Clp protease adaptor ClpS [Ignavibacteria bacterium]|nr:ATP-dependent Clp protease adaptor ClpS [Ignavibacteria bacterium]